MRRLVASGLLPERAGQPVKMWAHVSLAELRAMDDGSLLETEWVTQMRIRWSARRAGASGGAGSDGAVWLDGTAARGFACDAQITPSVTGDVDPGALDDLVRLCLQLAGHGTHCAPRPAPDPAPDPGPAGQPSPASPDPPAAASDPDLEPGPSGLDQLSTLSREAIRQAIIGKAADLLSGPGGLASFLRTASSAPGWPGPACPWTSATPAPSRPRSVPRSSFATSGAGGRAAVTSPPRPARSTTSKTRLTAVPPASKNASCCVPTTIRW
jgi:hypothetical protein